MQFFRDSLERIPSMELLSRQMPPHLLGVVSGTVEQVVMVVGIGDDCETMG